MFQYACGYAQSKRLNTNLVLDATWCYFNPIRTYELNHFLIDDRVRFPHGSNNFLIRTWYKFSNFFYKKRYKSFVDENPFVFDERINYIGDNTYLSGYWQSERYFSQYRKELLTLFQPKKVSQAASEWLKAVQGETSVSVHVRRGDYVALGVDVNSNYYHQAIKLIEEKVRNPKFFVFSDDLQFAQTMLEEVGIKNYRLVEYQSDNGTVEDMLIMSRCRHHVIANSSYSWWGAWLNENQDKIVICPEYRQWTGDFYPEEWVKIKIDSE